MKRQQPLNGDRAVVRNGQRKKKRKPANRNSKVVSLQAHRRKRRRLLDIVRSGLQGNERPWWIRAFAVIAIVAMLSYIVTLFLPAR